MAWILYILIGCGCGGDCAVNDRIPYATEAQCRQAARQVQLLNKSGTYSAVFCSPAAVAAPGL
jgi:hypothetical protein